MRGVKRPAPGSTAAAAEQGSASAGDDDGAAAIDPAAEYNLVHDISISKVLLAQAGSSDPAGEDTEWVCPDPILAFADAPFDARLARELRTTPGFKAPAPVQAACWPVALAGFDTVVVAQTGSGKTLGYLLPIFDAILRRREAEGHKTGERQASKHRSPLALVLAPTRELVVQIHEQAATYGSVAGITSIALYGGVPRQGQIAGCRMRPMLVVAAPGRLMDFLACEPRPALDVSATSLLVLDEADRMLDMGFAHELRGIIQRLPAPAGRQTLLFTATWPPTVRRLASELLRPTATVSVAIGQGGPVGFGSKLKGQPGSKLGGGMLAANLRVRQVVYALGAADGQVEADSKLFEILEEVLGGSNKEATAIVFVNRKVTADELAGRIRLHSVLWTAGAIHGDRTQAERTQALHRFTTKAVRVLVATDVAARGLDIKGVDCVVNYEFPVQKAKAVENYVHRIGRCGRAGASGVAYTLFRPQADGLHAKQLLKLLKQAGQPRPPWLKQLGKRHGATKQRDKVRKEAQRLGRMMSQHRYEADSVVSCTSDLAESEASYDRDDGQRKQDAAKRRAHGNDKPKEYNKNKGK